jgi:hypothetical protein
VCLYEERITILSIELAAGRRLPGIHLPGADFGLEVVFAANRTARESAKHSELTDVRERIGDGSLKQLLGAESTVLFIGDVRIKRGERVEEPRDLAVPRKRAGVVPDLRAFR